MKKTLLFITAASLLLVSCAKEQLVEQTTQNGPVNVVSATFEDLVGDDATKASVEDAGTFSWQNGDEAAFAGTTGYLKAQNSASGATASFTYSGTLATSTYGIFPYDLTTDQSVNDSKVKVPASREWVESQTNVAMYATYAYEKFSFEHLGGLVKVTVNNVPTDANKFVFKTEGWRINGVFDITDSNSKKIISTIATSTPSESEYALTFTSPQSAGTAMTFYVPLPVGTYDKGFAVYLKNGDTVLSQFKGSTSQTVSRKSFLIMPAITLVSASIEDVYKDALVETIPAGYSGDYLLPKTDKLVLKIKASNDDHDITLKYNGENIPTNLEIKVVDGDTGDAGNFNAKLIGDLPYTHVDFNQGHIDYTELITSASTFAVIHPATVGTLTVKGGNVVLQGATVNMIEVAEGAVADKTSNDPIEIKMEKYTPTGGSEQTPEVTGSVVAMANVKVAPVENQTVAVVKVGSVTVEDTGAGTVEEKNNEVSVSDFEGFKSAVNSIVAGQTIKVTADITDAKGISVPSGKNFTVDFGGHTYAMEYPGAGSEGTKTLGFQLLKGSTIVFKNGTIECTTANKDKTWSSGDASKGIAMMIQNYANLTLENMTIDATNIAHNGTSGTARYAVSNNCGTVEFKGTTTIKAPVAGDFAFDVCKSGTYAEPKVTWNSTGSVTGKIELTGGEFVVAQNLTLTQPIRTKDAAAKLTVNANITPASDWNAGDALVIVNRTGDLTISGSGKISGNNTVSAAVKMTEKTVDEADAIKNEVAKLTVDGTVTLEGDYYGIVGNGSRHGTEITVNGGTIKGVHANDNLGIFHPQDGKLTISGGKIEGYSSAVEVRAGTVKISSDASLKSTATTFSCSKNGSGNTTVGAALAIAQHTTRKAIDVTIDGGTFTGYKAISVEDPEDGDPQNVQVVINGGTFSDMSGVNYVADNGKYKLANNVELSDILTINSGKKFNIDLGGKTLTGRTNITHGNVTFANGTIQGATGNVDSKYKQALNVYGSSESSADNYSVVKVASSAAVKAEVFGVCLFGPTAGANAGYGAGIDIEGTVTTINESSSNEGAVFVSGNLGGSQESNTQTAMEGKNFVKISGTVTSASDAALALNGSATATITGTLKGNTGIAAKRGKLIVESGAFITGNGTCVGAPASNGNGTELTGSAVSASSTYGQQLSIDLQGGTYTSKAYTILNNAADDACNFKISGGSYTTTKETDGIAVYARLGSVDITGGEFTNNSKSEATLHVGCPSANLSNGPKLTISGEKTIVKNTASGEYTYGGKPLVVNMANQLTYKAVEISGGKFYYRDPSKDDNVQGDNGNFLKDGFSVSGDETNGWTVSAKNN